MHINGITHTTLWLIVIQSGHQKIHEHLGIFKYQPNKNGKQKK
jgi:hypothetical protein